VTIGLTDTPEQEVEWRLESGDHVRLREEVADIYVAAYAGAEGWVRNRMIDRMGNFKMVFVQWDRDHWLTNDQQDMWTYEDHFDKIEEEDEPVAEAPDKSDVAKALNVLASALGVEDANKGAENTDKDAEERAVEVTPENFQQFEAVLERAIEIARHSDAFLIATVEKEDAPEGSGADFVLAPHIYSYALSPESAVLLDAQLSEITSASHQGLAMQELRRILDKPSEEKD
jgi:hypothetical protein